MNACEDACKNACKNDNMNACMNVSLNAFMNLNELTEDDMKIHIENSGKKSSFLHYSTDSP